MHLRIPILLALAIIPVSAQSVITPIAPDTANQTLNRTEISRLRAQRATTPKKGTGQKGAVIVMPGDWVLPQFVDGAGWKSSIYITNLGSTQSHASVYFMDNAGNDMTVDILASGGQRGVSATIPPGGTVIIQTAGKARTQTEGWALLLPDNIDDLLAVMGVFCYKAGSAPGFEAVVPAMSMIDTHFVLLYDNRNGYVSAMAAVNPSADSPSTLTVTIKDTAGAVIKTESSRYLPGQHEAFLVADRWPETRGKAGSIEFQAAYDSYVAVLGLRGSPDGPITSVHTLMIPDWFPW